jgi:hypothetical protein
MDFVTVSLLVMLLSGVWLTVLLKPHWLSVALAILALWLYSALNPATGLPWFRTTSFEIWVHDSGVLFIPASQVM